MAKYEDFLNNGYEKDGVLYEMAKEILELRQMIWLDHGHNPSVAYGDDGEMQCHQCLKEYGFWDWKRTDLKEIVSKISDANMKRFAEYQKHLKHPVEKESDENQIQSDKQ